MYWELWFYEPEIRQYVDNPETSVIFPYFFWLHPLNNPWRAGLELFENWIDINELSSFCIIRVLTKEADVSKIIWDEYIWYTRTRFSEIENEDVIDDIVAQISKIKWVSFVKSTRRKNVWSLWSKTKNDLEDCINLIQFEISKLGYILYPMMFHDRVKDDLQTVFSKKIFLWRWYGTLIEALRFDGITIDISYQNIEKHLYDYNWKKNDFNVNILPKLESHFYSNDCDSCLLFFKEPSRSAREMNSHENKIEAIEFIDTIVWKILEKFIWNDIDIIVLSDHQSNIWNKRTFKGKTLYYHWNLKIKKSHQSKFDEKTAEIIWNQIVVDQNQLIKKLKQKN